MPDKFVAFGIEITSWIALLANSVVTVMCGLYVRERNRADNLSDRMGRALVAWGEAQEQKYLDTVKRANSLTNISRSKDKDKTNTDV
jgi:hypothetical protein